MDKNIRKLTIISGRKLPSKRSCLESTNNEIKTDGNNSLMIQNLFPYSKIHDFTDISHNNTGLATDFH